MTGNDTDGSRTPDERANSEVSQAQNEEQDVKRTKRKKASRACFHCQKAHLTCDDSRPCQRCIKRGLDASCQDGIRKRAKYLQDIDNETQEVVNTNSAIALTSVRSENPNSASYQSDSGPQLSSIGSVHEGTVNLAAVSRPTKRIIGAQDNGFGMIGDNLLFDYPLLSSYDFDSKAANMEYSMLSNMLGNATTPGTDYGHSPDTTSFTSPGMNNIQRTLPSRQHTITPDQASVASESSWTQIPIGGSSGGGSTLKHSLPQSQSSMAYTNSSQTPNSNVQVVDSSNTPKSPMLQTPAAAMTQSGRHGNQYVDPHGQRPTPVARRPHSGSRDGRGSIYKAIIKPFSYTNGYHLLNTYLRSRFEKEDLLRIARAIVGYRPSFIALTKTLKEEDLIFMEVCFQRTLLEYEKFVGYSGTPTIIWRRTGQIELVGKEFCLLTQWSREQLLSKQTFIVELMDDSSVVEYFEKFSAHAFGDTSSVQTTCVLMTPQKRAVPCAFCFTIKRDVFDIPMMIVGNFLPVL